MRLLNVANFVPPNTIEAKITMVQWSQEYIFIGPEPFHCIPPGHFREIPLALIPVLQQPTAQQQSAYAAQMAVRPSMAHLIRHRLAVTMPDNVVTVAYQTWYSENRAHHTDAYGVMTECPTEWAANYGQAAAEGVISSLITLGYPPCHWMQLPIYEGPTD